MAHYVHDEKNNRIEALSKEETYALLAEAIQEGELPSVDEDTAFVTMFKSIVDGKAYKMAFCTQAQYNQLEAQGLLVADAYYIITDDETYDDLVIYINNQIATLENKKLNKDSLALSSHSIQLINENGEFIIQTNDDDAGNTLQLKFKQDTAQLIYIPYVGDTETYNLLTVLGQVATNTSNIAALTPKTLYTNNNNYNLTPSNWVTLNLSETITNTSILELYATLRINDSTVYTKFNGKVQLSNNLFTDVFISFPMFNYGAGSGQAIGMVVIYVKYNSATSVQVKLDTLSIANSSIFVNSLPTAFNAKIDKILLINN